MKHLLMKAYRGAGKIWSYGVYGVLSTGFIKLYQPLYGREGKTGDVIRDCEDRWNVIAPHLPKEGALLDVGCNLGYFSFRAVEKNFAPLGVDHDAFNIMYCRAIANAKKIKNIHFWDYNLGPDEIALLPHFKVIFNFSVFHHWVKAYGQDKACLMLRGLADKCDCLFFETGQPDEIGTKWASKMNFMGDQPVKWIEDFLKDAGFDDVRVIGTFDTGLTDVKRSLFVAKKKSAL